MSTVAAKTHRIDPFTLTVYVPLADTADDNERIWNAAADDVYSSGYEFVDDLDPIGFDAGYLAFALQSRTED